MERNKITAEFANLNSREIHVAIMRVRKYRSIGPGRVTVESSLHKNTTTIRGNIHLLMIAIDDLFSALRGDIMLFQCHTDADRNIRIRVQEKASRNSELGLDKSFIEEGSIFNHVLILHGGQIIERHKSLEVVLPHENNLVQQGLQPTTKCGVSLRCSLHLVSSELKRYALKPNEEIWLQD